MAQDGVLKGWTVSSLLQTNGLLSVSLKALQQGTAGLLGLSRLLACPLIRSGC